MYASARYVCMDRCMDVYMYVCVYVCKYSVRNSWAHIAICYTQNCLSCYSKLNLGGKFHVEVLLITLI